MGHIITLILDLLTHSTVPSWFSWHDCRQQREKCGMCKWFPLVLSIEMCGHLLPICICTCLVIQLQSAQWVRKATCIALMCIRLIYSLHLCPGSCVCVSVCIKYSRANICTSMCNMTLVCVVQLPLQHVAWWVCGAGLCGQESSSWQSGLLLQRKAYVGLTGQAVQGSHQNEPFIKSCANGNCSCEDVGCIPCLKSKKLMRNVEKLVLV